MEELGYLWKRRHELLYKAQLSALYHQRRERFFEQADKLGKVIAIVGGSASLWRIADASLVAGILVVITTWSAVSLVFSLTDRARRHAEMASKWREFAGRMLVRGERDFSEADLNAWEGEAAMLESTEPPALSALVVDCQNEIAIATGQPAKVVHLRWWERLLLHFLNMPRSAGASDSDPHRSATVP